MTAAVGSSPPPQLPSYSEALQWGFTPPPRITWAPPREDPASPRPRLARPRTSVVRPFSMSTISESTLLGRSAGHRPSTSSGGSRETPSPAPSSSSSSPPARPSTAQPPAASSSSLLAVPSPPSPHDHDLLLPPEPRSPAYSPTQEDFIPDPVPLHPRPPIPPGYSRHDPAAATLLMRPPLVYSSSGSSPQTPAFHLQGRPGRAGRPYQLRIRQLDHLESRTLAFDARGHHHRLLPPHAGAEDEHTLFLLQVMQLVGGGGVVPGLGPSWRVEVHRNPGHGGSSSSGGGIIRFEGGGVLGGMRRSGCKFWYMTRRSGGRASSSKKPPSARYGYQPDSEWDRRLLFSAGRRRGALGLGGGARGCEWRDARGRVVAVESAEGRLDLSRLAACMSPQSRESLLACWVGKRWASGELEL